MFNWNNTVLTRDAFFRIKEMTAGFKEFLMAVAVFIFQFTAILTTVCAQVLPGDTNDGGIIALSILAWVLVGLTAVAGLVEIVD